MAGYIGTKAVNLSTTGADIAGDADVSGALDVGGAFTSQGIDDNANATAITIDSSENVGIGTDSPSSTLEVKGANNSDTILTVTGGTTAGLGSNAKIKLVPDGTAGLGVINVEGSDGSDVLAFETNGSEAMRIDSSGNVGIGTTTSSGLLTVGNGLTGTKTIAINGGGSGSSVMNLDFLGGGSGNPSGRISYSSSTEEMTFHTGDLASIAEHMRIDAFGRLLIGYTSATLDASTSIQTRKSSGNNAIYCISDSTGTSQQSSMTAIATHSTNNWFATLAVYRQGSNNPSGYVNVQDRNRISHFIWSDTSSKIRTSSTAGNIGGTGGTIIGTQTSDERLKTIEDSFEYGIETVKQLSPIAYKFNDDETETRHLGFGAQTTQSIVPEAVYDSGDCIDGYDEDPDDNMVQSPRSDATKMMMDGIQLVPVLTAALKEAIAKIESLEARLAALEAN
jgi:hypothetical protein